MTSEPSQGTLEHDHYILEEGEVTDIIRAEPKEEEQGWVSGHPADQLEKVPIRREDITNVVKVRRELDHEVKRDLIELFGEYSDIFAWSHEEMPGIPLGLATHRLAVDATFKPIKQK